MARLSRIQLLLYGLALQLVDSQAACAGSIQLSSAAISALDNSPTQVAAKYSLGAYKQVEPGVYEHYSGGRFLHKDTAGQWVYSSARDNDDMNRLQGTASECPEDTTVEWRWNKGTTLTRWKGGSVDTTFLVQEYRPIEEENLVLLRGVREALYKHTNATHILEETNNILTENQDTNKELLNLVRTSMSESCLAQSDTNQLLEEIGTSLTSSQENMKTLSSESLKSNTLLGSIKTSFEKSLVETKTLSTALASNTETAIKDSLDSSIAINGDTNRLLREIKVTMIQSRQEATAAIKNLVTQLSAIAEIVNSYKREEPTKITDKSGLDSYKSNSSRLGSESKFDFYKHEKIEPDLGFGLMTLPATYQKNKSPSEDKDGYQPTEVRVVLQPKSITEISSMDKTVGLEIYMSLAWKDPRVDWNDLTQDFACSDTLSFSPNILRDFWTPDPVFKNQDSISKIESIILNNTDSNFQVRTTCTCDKDDNLCKPETAFKDSAQLMFNQTIKVLVDCPEMEFRKFPMDTQRCGFYMSTLRQDKNVVWLPAQLDTTFLDQMSNSEFHIQIRSDKEVPGFSGFEIQMRRKPQVFYYAYFCPCTLMVVVSWVSFSVKADAVPGRLGLLLTLLLMMINLTNSAAKIIPGSDSMCPLIAWIWMSIAFVNFALIEYFVILTILKFSKLKVAMEPKLKKEKEKEFGEQKDPWIMVVKELRQENLEDIWALRLDRGALFILPIIYILSVIIFVLNNQD